MRVLLITDSYPPEIRSASALMAEMAQDFRARGFAVGVLTSTPRYNLSRWPFAGRKRFFYRETIAGINVLRVHTLPLHNVGHLRRGIGQLLLPAIFTLPCFFLGKAEAAVVYSPPLTLGLAAYLMKMLRGTRFILNVQDIFPQNAIDLGALRNPLVVAAFRKLEKFVYRHAEFITVHSGANRRALIAAGVDAGKIRVIHNWIDTSAYLGKPGPPPLRDPEALRGRFTVLFAGVMGYAQDLDIVLAAAEILRERKDILFLLVGDGPCRLQLEEKARAAGLANVLFHPFVQLERYPDLARAADCGLVTLQPAMKTPVVPSKILGYMAAAIPVIGCLNPESEAIDIIEESGAGFARSIRTPNEIAEKIRLLADDRELAKKMGRDGREYVRANFSPDACLAEYERILNRILQKN